MYWYERVMIGSYWMVTRCLQQCAVVGLREGCSHRIADAEVRYKRLRLPDPKGKAEPVVVYGVHVREAAAPGDESPVEWMLLTSMPVESVADAKRVLGMYVKRWRVEDFFRILKSGCKVERLGLRTSIRLEHAVTRISHQQVETA